MQKASVWAEKVMIPTYEIGEAEKNPIFLEKRVYQGSCGKVYPYPTIEKISDEKKDKEYTAQQISPPLIVSLSIKEQELLNKYMKNFETIGYGWKMSTLRLWFFQSLADESRGHMIKQMIMILFTITR